MRAVPLEQDHVISQPDAPRPHHLKPDIDAAEQIEQMAPIGREALAIGAERAKNLRGLRSPNPPKARPQIAELLLSVLVPLGELLQQVQRARAFRLLQRRMDRLNALFPVDLVTGHLQDRQLRKLGDGPAVTVGERLRRVPAAGTIVPALLPRQNNAGRHALDVPFPRAANRLVEIVQVED